MSAATAHVDVLTAEVRSLMVGSRQVTLSVYRQLDTMEPLVDLTTDFEPFGRVTSGTRYVEFGDWGREFKAEALCEFVGRRRSDGTLVRFVVMGTDWRTLDADDKATITAWRALPLIVLAGLK